MGSLRHPGASLRPIYSSISLRDGKIPAQRSLIYWEKLRGIRSSMAGSTKTRGWSLARDRP